ncbi:MAG: hypothetical protein J0L81_06635 [Caulobacterales bacterium]|jgi:hypothetical protein|nr:hypothetical protein [Caulobacterales bacterium]
MAAKKSKAGKPDPLQEAAVEYFSGRSHDAWRRNFHKTSPAEKKLPRMRLRGGIMVDINQPWRTLDPAAKADNKRAARDAFDAVKKFPNDREAASDYVHKRWILRNKADKSLAKDLFKPYMQLSEAEKDKDRAHVDRMKAALAAVRKVKTARKAPAAKTVRIDARQWARLEAAAKRLSVTPEALLRAGIDAVVAVSGAAAPKPRAKKR